MFKKFGQHTVRLSCDDIILMSYLHCIFISGVQFSFYPLFAFNYIWCLLLGPRLGPSCTFYSNFMVLSFHFGDYKSQFSAPTRSASVTRSLGLTLNIWSIYYYPQRKADLSRSLFSFLIFIINPNRNNRQVSKWINSGPKV